MSCNGGKCTVHEKGRILYVEPNEVFGNVNGVPVTPDYSDLCISFNLIVEVVSRYKQTAKIGESDSGKYNIFWTSKLGLDQSKNWVSFLSGEQMGDKAFLTTYYTDTSYEDILKKNIVEGLGIENITVAFENYYTPTVTIKFVDQRGSSLFGREEATHYNDKLTIDNIFGAFFTAPYPKFKLQIKGFYGKPVTLQLTCSGFKGNLNPQTGNFEATATFIGYSYSLLTDIPFQYIVAAPYCDYAGRQYWFSKVSSPEWRPMKSGGKQMPRIYEFVEKLNRAFSNGDLLKMLTQEDNELLQSSEAEKAALNSLYATYARFLQILIEESGATTVKNYDLTNQALEREQLLLFCEKPTIITSGTIATAFATLSDELKGYNQDYPSNSIPLQELPNEWHETFPDLGCVDLFEISETEDGIRVVSCKQCDEMTVENLCKINFGLKSDGSGDFRCLEQNTAEILVKYLNQDVTNNIQRYAALIDLHAFRKKINDRLTEIDDVVNRIELQTERDYVRLAQSELQLVPYIGNIFKMIMCHIETLVYMMYKCFENIKADEAKGNRSPTYLRVNLTNTDVIPDSGSVNVVPAWPMVTRAASSNNENKSLEDENTIGWVGDFSPYFEEEKLVKALFMACKKTNNGSINSEEENSNITYVPILPCDVNDIYTVFNVNEDKCGISYLAGLLGLRAAQLFGIMESGSVPQDVAETAGRMDAYNYYIKMGSKSVIKNAITDVSGNKPLADKLYDIMLCKPEEDNMGETQESTGIQVHPFETDKGIMSSVIKNGRDPIFVENSGNLAYVHYYTKSKHALVPSTIKDFSDYNSDEFSYTYEGQAGSPTSTYFDFKTEKNENVVVSRNVLFNCNDKTLFKDREDSPRYTDYLNYEMFNVLTRPTVVSGIIKRYNELKNGNFEIFGQKYEDDFNKILNRYWDLGEDTYVKFFPNPEDFLTGKYDDARNNEVFNSQKHKTASNITLPDVSLKRSTSEDAWINDGNTVSTDNLFVPQLKIWEWSGSRFYYSQLFGEDFYYMQNDISDTDLIDKCKALLFLHSVTQTQIVPNIIKAFSKSKEHGGIQAIPYGISLLLGGLLWRKRYMENDENHRDPIKYSGEVSIGNGNRAPLQYKRPRNGSYSLFNMASDGTCHFIIEKGNSERFNVSLSKLFGETIPDYHISNALIKNFEVFVSEEWKTIKDGLELVSLLSDGTKSAFNCETFSFFRTYFYNIIDKTTTSDSESVDAFNTKVNKLIRGNLYNSDKQYRFIRPYSTYLYCINEQNNDSVQRLLKRLYSSKAIIVDTSSKTRDRTVDEQTPTISDVTVSPSALKSYLSGFSNMLKKIVDSASDVTVAENNDAGNPDDPDAAEFTRDVAIPIYLYLKMLWDKWLAGSNCTPTDHEYTVKNFFNNFVFIDSFYRNIESRLMMNCQVFLEVYEGNTFSNEDTTVFKVIGDLTTHHHCLFLAIPDFIDNLASGDSSKAKAALESMFVPIPYSEVEEPRRNNKFVIIYVPKLSESPSELNNYKEDGFNIWSYNDAQAMDDANIPKDYRLDNDRSFPPILKKTSSDFSENDEISRYGYFVPSFGFAYGYQNNHLFKNVSLNMETPIITSAVINTLSHIAKQGSGNQHKIAYIGQDLYPVFSNYSYICEFEMMGCAQVQPLMYFQLMNVPMWRGTYMIFNVTHTMTPGNMTTRVRAMKLSNRAIPYSNAWFTKNLNYSDDESNGSNNQCEEEPQQSGGYSPTANGISNGDTSYDYNQYKHLVKQKRNVCMDKVLSGVTTFVAQSDCGRNKKHGPYSPHHKMKGTWKLDYDIYHGKCSSGPTTWYGRGGIDLHFWRDTGSYTTTVKASAYMPQQGFKIVKWSESIDTMDSNKAKKIQDDIGHHWDGIEPGDIMIIYGRHSDGGATAHAAMWTGKDWRSDCVQRHAGCEAGLRKPAEYGSVQIWRFDDETYEKYHNGQQNKNKTC